MPDDFGAVPYSAYSEAVGDADAVKSSGLGLRNLKRLVPMLVPATTHQLDDVQETKEGYDRIIGQYLNEMRHVAAIVGGADGQRSTARSRPRFTPIPRERQRAAVQFLQENVFATPTWLLDPAILRRLEPEGAVSRINRAQRSILGYVMNDDRMARLVEYEALPGTVRPYALSEFLADMRSGIWTELGAGSVRVDAYRRGLQRIYLEAVAAKLAANPSNAPASRSRRPTVRRSWHRPGRPRM